MADHKDFDAATGRTTTGHEWDGIKELNTPLPRWWLLVFYATIVWAFGYWVVYPSWPLIGSYLPGLFHYSSRAEVKAEVDKLQLVRGEKAAALRNVSLAEIESDPGLLAIARAQGKAAFGDNCAPCHGSGAAGAKGYPNLNDDDWLWGGTLDQIHDTIRFGARATDPKSHSGEMLAFGRTNMLKRDEIVTVANYVRSLSGLPVRPGIDLAAGQKIFAAQCASCHGDDGKGKTVTNGRAGMMPAWAGRLDPVTIKALAVYVHTLGGGK
jgi:cytochrome c oxidase cbb3-type subunit 3